MSDVPLLNSLKFFIDKWHGEKCDFDGKYQGQCVDLFRQYVQDVLKFPQPKGVVGAADFWSNYDLDPNLKNYYNKIANTPAFVPQAGDVMLWNKRAGGGFGHVAIVTAHPADTKGFSSFDQNWSKISVCEVVEHDYKNVYGVFRPKPELILPQPSSPLKYTEEEYSEVRLARDKWWNLLIKIVDSIEKI